MEILVNGSLIRLSDQDFLSEGGEGRVYVKNNLAYKIYTDLKKLQPNKIKELSVLDKKYICRPLKLIKNLNRQPIGFTMAYIPKGIPLCKFFTSEYWRKNNLSIKNIIKIVQQLQEGIRYVHSKGILLVDINEFNFLVQHNNISYFIDVDSYQTPNNPATAIMPHIRDYHARAFSKITDWFSFAIIVCQLFVGIHPFKGRHPDYSKKDLARRMKDNISIFHPKVKVPMAARDFSYIPTEYKDWFLSIFVYGERTSPPEYLGKTQTRIVASTTTEISGNFEVGLMSDFISPKKTEFMNEEIRYINGIPFVRMGNYLLEIFIEKPFDKEIIATKQSWRILPHATQIMDGVVCQNILGKKHLSFFYKNSKEKTCYSISPISELDKYKLVEAKQEKGICIMIGNYKGQYDELIFKFNANYTNYSIQKNEDIDYIGINFTVLDNGTVVTFEEGHARLFSANVNSTKINIIKNTSINPRMRICSDGNQVRYVENNKLYSIRMK